MRVLDQKAFWVWGGIATLTLMCIYMTIGSGFVAVRTGLGMTELEFLNWWPMRVMAGVLAVTLVMVHRWIPLSWESLGVWMVHGGVLVLLAGSVWYFSQKTEGMVR
ncbi:MAG: hypothetical protein FWD53_08855, partial [Phycisphaerales bacterium]|nr:hypothetical protein [Phycisphaerales bacterium]